MEPKDLWRGVKIEGLTGLGFTLKYLAGDRVQGYGHAKSWQDVTAMAEAWLNCGTLTGRRKEG